MKKENNLIQTLSFLAVQMEDSETQLINAIAPGTLPEYERPRRRNERREPLVADEPRYKTEMVDQVVLKNKQLADFLAVTPLQAAIFVAGFAQNVDRKDFDKDNICSFFGIKSMEFLMMRNDFDELQDVPAEKILRGSDSVTHADMHKTKRNHLKKENKILNKTK